LVPRAIRAFREAYPLVSVRLEERLGGELLGLLRSEQIDVAFIRMPHVDQEGLVINRLLEEPMLAALPGAHAPARSGSKGESPLSLKHLARETFILYGPPGIGLREVTMAACHAAGFSPRAGQEAPRIASTLSLVAVGLGISLVPASLRHLYVDGVVYRRLRGSIQPKAPLDLASRRGDSSVVVQNFLKLVRQAAKNSRFDESEPRGRTR
jgi:DNA-binding transcriptional LysR family regulator